LVSDNHGSGKGGNKKQGGGKKIRMSRTILAADDGVGWGGNKTRCTTVTKDLSK